MAIGRNTLILFDRFGKQVLKFSKVHTCDFDVERNLTPGDGFHVTYLPELSGSRDTCILEADESEEIHEPFVREDYRE